MWWWLMSRADYIFPFCQERNKYSNDKQVAVRFPKELYLPSQRKRMIVYLYWCQESLDGRDGVGWIRIITGSSDVSHSPLSINFHHKYD